MGNGEQSAMIAQEMKEMKDEIIYYGEAASRPYKPRSNYFVTPLIADPLAF